MLNIEQLTNEQISKTQTIEIKPSDNLFKELGNNTYDFLDLISELIDNAIAARIKNKILNISIIIGISKKDKCAKYILIKDDANGIPRTIIGDALSPASMSGGQSLNEHGLGMKQSISALGYLYYIITKTTNDSDAMLIKELKFGELLVNLIKVDWSHGTEICIKNVNQIVPIRPQSYTMSVIPYLGARYRRFLKSEKPDMNLKIQLANADNNDKILNSYNITPIFPVYYHPNKHINEPICYKNFKGGGWEADLTFGYAPTTRQYEYMGLTSPDRYDPYTVSLSKQGLDLIKNDRVLKFHMLSELGLANVNHSKFNYFRGEVNLIIGFCTANTKNNIIQDSNFQELKQALYDFFTENRWLQGYKTSKDLPESLLRDRLKKHLLTRSIDRKKDVITEYPIKTINSFIDILADNEAWEIKTEIANATNVFQLFGYMDIANISKGYLIAPSFGEGATYAVNYIYKKYHKNIILAKLDEFPINHEPNDYELNKYYPR